MRKSKNVLVLASVTVFVFTFVITGCSNTVNTNIKASTVVSERTNTEEATAASDPAQKPAAPYQISWYYVGPGEQKDTALVETELGKYLTAKINATIKLNLIDWATYKNKMNAMIAAGEPFDICFTALWVNDYVSNSQNGAFVALDDYLNKELAGTKKILGDDFLNASKINGHNYGIPCNKEKARDWGFVYNKTLADKYNIDMSNVKSFKDIEPALKIIKEKEPDVVPLHWEKHGATSYIPWNAENLFDDGQITVILPNGKVVDAIETPEVKAAYMISRDFYNKGYYRKDVLTSKDGPTIRKSGKFFAFGMNLKPGYAAELNGDKSLGFEHAQIDVTEPIMTNTDTMGSLQAISRTSKDPQRAAMFLELVNTDPVVSNLVNYGIEGKHYTKVDDNTINPIKDSAYQPNMQWMFGNQMIAYLYANEDPKKWENFTTFNAMAKKAPDLGFIFNKDPIVNEMAACANVAKEYHEALDCGAVDPVVKLPEFISKLKAAGVDKIVAEEQKQFDAFKATQ